MSTFICPAIPGFIGTWDLDHDGETVVTVIMYSPHPAVGGEMDRVYVRDEASVDYLKPEHGRMQRLFADLGLFRVLEL